MKTVPKIVGAAVALLVTASLVQAQDHIKLRYDFKKDKKYIYRKTETMKQTQTVMDKKIEVSSDSTKINVLTLEKVDDKGNLHLQSENKALKVKMNFNNSKYEFDSKKNDNDKASQLGAIMTPLYERMSGGMLTIVISPRGKVEEVKGFKELIRDVLKDNPLAQQLTGGGTDKGAKLSFSEFFPTMSEKPVQSGDTWEVPFEIELPKVGKVVGKKLYTYEGAGKVGNRKTARISVTAEMSIDVKLDQDGAKVTGNMSITNSSGTIHFDPKAGHIISLKTNYTLSGNLNVNVNNMDIGVGTEQAHQTTMELLDKLPE